MKIINEDTINNIVKKTINEYMNEKVFLDYWDSQSSRLLIFEGITMTYDPRRVMGIVERKYGLEEHGLRISWLRRNGMDHPIVKNTQRKPKNNKNEIFQTEDYNQIIEISLSVKPFHLFKNIDIINSIISTMDSCGWMMVQILDFYTNVIYKDIGDLTDESHPIGFIFRPRLDQTVNNEAIPNRCYHICPLRVVNKILEKGLIPHDLGRNSNHPSRVYLFWNKPNDWKNIADRFRESRNDEPYTMLSIDMNQIRKKIKFRFDSLTMTDHPAIYIRRSQYHIMP